MDNNQVKFASIDEDIRAKLFSGDEQLVKSASLAADEYFRVRVRENGVRRQITPPKQVTDADFDYTEYTDFPVMFAEIEPNSAGAVRISFEAGPSNEVIHALKTRIEFAPIITPKYSIEKIRLKGYKMPLLDIMYDLMLKDLMDCEDTALMAVDDFILGVRNADNDQIGCRRWITVGAMSRASMTHAGKAMFATPGHIPLKQYVLNQGTYMDLGQFGREDVGGDLAQDVWINGVVQTKMFGVPTVVTQKRELIADDDMYIYSDPRFYGGFYTYEDVSMITDEQDGYWLSFFMREIIGASVVNAAGVAKVSFNGTLVPWYQDGVHTYQEDGTPN